MLKDFKQLILIDKTERLVNLRYVDFVDLNYKPRETDVVCTFYVEPRGVSLEEAAGGV